MVRNSLIAFILALPLIIVQSAWAQDAVAVDESMVQSYRERIAAAPHAEEKARLHRELGLYLMDHEEVEGSADEMAAALELYDGFTDSEKTQMALYISWAERYQEAIDIYRGILERNPDDIEARVNLAKTLLWDGRNTEALSEAEKVLAVDPEHRGARLVKANAIHWSGEPLRARPLYEGILSEEDDFDTRLGLTYAFRELGKRRDAIRSMKKLEPEYPYQMRLYEKLEASLRRDTRPTLDPYYRYYYDSDENEVHTYGGILGFWVLDVRTTVRYIHTEARDPIRRNHSEEVLADFIVRPTDSLLLGAGGGYARASGALPGDFAVWSARAELRVGKATLGVRAHRELFNDTAQLIDNAIRFTSINPFVTMTPVDRLYVYVGYFWRDYSDENTANDARLTLKYTLRTQNPTLWAGYRFRFLDFARQSGGGYFDPDNFHSHVGFVALYYEDSKIYVYVEPYAGYQRFDRNGVPSDGVIGGGNGLLGIKLHRNVVLEITAEGGNFALGSATGFEYYMVGSRLKITF